MTTMTITRALAEIKLLEQKAQKATTRGYVDVYSKKSGDRAINSNMDMQSLVSAIKSEWQSYKDIIKRRDAIKHAILKSNNETTVKIGKQEMTVAEAIDKKHSIGLKKQMLASLKTQWVGVGNAIEQKQRDIDRHNEKNNNQAG